MVLALYTREKSPDTNLIEGWVGPRTGLDVNRGEKNLATAGN
jgi:hypothetical protein